MRQLCIIGLTFVSLSCGNPQTTSKEQAQDNTGYTIYTNKDKGFSISYPASWDTTLKDPNMVFIAVERDPDTTDKFNESLNISVFPNEGLTPEQMVEKNVQGTIKDYGNSVIRSTQKSPNGLDCTILQINQTSHGIALITYSALFDNGSHLYTITSTMEASKQDKYITILTSVLNSFNWTK